MAVSVNGGNTYSGITIKLGVDINLQNKPWTPIGWFNSDTDESCQFQGTFDGDGHTISNLTVSGDRNVGLFGYNAGTIQNLTLADATVSGNSYVGGLVGENWGPVQKCSFSGTVSGNERVGGLVGYNENGTVSNNTVSGGTVSGKDYVGGVVGQNWSGSTISGNTVVSEVSGSYGVGGLVGLNYGTVSDNKFYSNADAVGYNSGSASNNKSLYVVTLPGGVTATGDACVTANGTTYASGTITLAGKTGYTYSGTTTANITAATDLSNLGTATFDTANHYVLANNTSTLATTTNTTAYPDLVQVHALTLQGVTVTGDSVVTDTDGKYYATGSVTVAAKTGYTITTSTVDVTEDTTISATLDTSNHYVLANNTSTLATADNTTDYPDLIQVYALTLQGVTVTGDSVVTIDGTTYAKDSVTVAAKTGYVLSGETSLNVAQDTTVSASLDTANHYVFGTSGNYTLATADNTTAYPDLIQVYALNLPEGVTVSGSLLTDGNTAYVTTGNVTLSAAEGYTLQNVKVDGKELTDNFTFTVSADTTITADSVKFGNGGKSVVVGGTTGDFGEYDGLYSITASQQNSTLVGNNNNNTVILEGGGVNILTGGSGNDTFKFGAGGGIVTDYGIGATKSGDGSTLKNPLGTDVIKLDGKVSGVYFDRAASSKKEATFTAVITYDSDEVAGDDTQIIVLQNINKKPTKYGSNPVYQTNDVAAATMKIWDTSGSKQAVLSASKLKALFHDDSDLSELVQSKVTYLGEIAKGETPTTNPFEQTAQATYSGDNG